MQRKPNLLSKKIKGKNLQNNVINNYMSDHLVVFT